MKQIIAGLTVLVMAGGAHAASKHLRCDIHLVTMLGEEVTQVRGSNPGGAQVVDNGKQFQLILPEGVVTSGTLQKYSDGTERYFGCFMYVKINCTYRIGDYGSNWVLVSGCK